SRSLRANSAAARRSNCVWRPHRAYGAAHAYDTAGPQGASGRGWRRHTRVSGVGGGGLSAARHVHVIGIGGSAMAPLAGMLREHGFRVTGSDSGVYPPASTLLESLRIAYYNTFDAAHLQSPPHLAVIGNVIARGDPELE